MRASLSNPVPPHGAVLAVARSLEVTSGGSQGIARLSTGFRCLSERANDAFDAVAFDAPAPVVPMQPQMLKDNANNTVCSKCPRVITSTQTFFGPLFLSNQRPRQQRCLKAYRRPP